MMRLVKRSDYKPSPRGEGAHLKNQRWAGEGFGNIQKNIILSFIFSSVDPLIRRCAPPSPQGEGMEKLL